MVRRNSGILDSLGNYFCGLGNSNEKLPFLAIPLAILAVIYIAVFALSSSVFTALETFIVELNLSDNMSAEITKALGNVYWAWVIAGLMMLWQRYRGSVNGIQTTTTTMFYLTIAFAVISKFMNDIDAGKLKASGLELLVYVTTTLIALIAYCLMAVITTAFGVPIVVSAAVIVGVLIDLAVAFICAESIRSSRCFKAIENMLEEVDLDTQVAEVQLIDTGLYFVNPSAKVVRRIHFSEFGYKKLNLFTRKPFLAQVMKLLPQGYYLDSLNNMWVANNKTLLEKLSKKETNVQH